MNYTTSERYDQAAINSNVQRNFRRLLGELGMTQKEFHEVTGISSPDVSDYYNGKKIPTLGKLLRIKELFKIDLDDFLTGDISMSLSDAPVDDTAVTESRRYLGTYYLCYFDSGEPSGADHLPTDHSVKYGVIFFYELQNTVVPSKFRCSMALDFVSMEAAQRFCNTLTAMPGVADAEHLIIEDPYGSGGRKRAYTGKYVLGKNQVFVSLRHSSGDRMMLIFNRCRDGASFHGALASANSVSFGSTERPAVQYIGISDAPMYLSAEEIQDGLMMGSRDIVCGDEVNSLIDLLKDLYSKENRTLAALSEDMVTMIVKAGVQCTVNELAKNNLSRYCKVDITDDQRWLSTVEKARKLASERNHLNLG